MTANQISRYGIASKAPHVNSTLLRVTPGRGRNVTSSRSGITHGQLEEISKPIVSNRPRIIDQEPSDRCLTKHHRYRCHDHETSTYAFLSSPTAQAIQTQ